MELDADHGVGPHLRRPPADRVQRGLVAAHREVRVYDADDLGGAIEVCRFEDEDV
jgi:hypothetical protein